MSRPLWFASSSASHCVVLFLAAAILSAAGPARAASPAWQPVRERPSRAASPTAAASQWAPTGAPTQEATDREAPSRRRDAAANPAVAPRTAAAVAAKAESPRWTLPTQNDRPALRAPSDEPPEPNPFVPAEEAADIASTSTSRQASHNGQSAAFVHRSSQSAASGTPPRRTAAGDRLSHDTLATDAQSAGNQHPESAARGPASRHRVRHAPGPYSGPPRQPSFAERVRHTMNVAFEGPHAWDDGAEIEDLPLPSRRNGPDGRPSHSVQHPGWHGYESVGPTIVYEGDYEVYHGCADGTCSSYGSSGWACDCGDGFGAAGCGCQPGSSGCRQRDLFCLGFGDDEACDTIRVRVPKVQELMVFGGAHGFKGPYDRDRDSGNFGFHKGLNAGFKIPYSTMGYQIGYQAVHSQLHGDKHTDISDSHTQHFLTAGVFQRVRDGLQYGVVWDMLHDERWGAVDFYQLRTEIAFIDRGCHEVGFAGTIGLNRRETFDDLKGTTTRWRATDQYLLFYRLHGKRGGEGRIYAGLTDDGDGVVGSDMLLPVSDRWSVMTGFTYLAPDARSGFEGASQEAWNIGLALVWHRDHRARKSHFNCYRPLFHVANNGTMIIDDRPGRQIDLIKELQ